MEKIDCTKRNATGVILISTMTDRCLIKEGIREDVREIFKHPVDGTVSALVDVVMTINGVEVPVEETLTKIWERENKRIEEKARTLAMEMVTTAGFEPLLEAIREAEYNIKSVIGNVVVDTYDSYADRQDIIEKLKSQGGDAFDHLCNAICYDTLLKVAKERGVK